MNLDRIFKTPSDWTQRASARTKHGFSINLLYLNRDDTKAMAKVQSWSLYGALAFFYSYEKDPEGRENARLKLRKAIRQVTGKDLSIAAFNDDRDTKFEDVKRVLEIFKAMRRERKDQKEKQYDRDTE